MREAFQFVAILYGVPAVILSTAMLIWVVIRLLSGLPLTIE